MRHATARVWEHPSLIHTASAPDAAGFRQSVMMPVIVRLWVASDTLVGGAPCGAVLPCGVVLLASAGAGLCPAVCFALLVVFVCFLFFQKPLQNL